MNQGGVSYENDPTWFYSTEESQPTAGKVLFSSTRWFDRFGHKPWIECQQEWVPPSAAGVEHIHTCWRRSGEGEPARSQCKTPHGWGESGLLCSQLLSLSERQKAECGLITLVSTLTCKWPESRLHWICNVPEWGLETVQPAALPSAAGPGCCAHCRERRFDDTCWHETPAELHAGWCWTERWDLDNVCTTRMKTESNAHCVLQLGEYAANLNKPLINRRLNFDRVCLSRYSSLSSLSPSCWTLLQPNTALMKTK